jgi:hypothetical protein
MFTWLELYPCSGQELVNPRRFQRTETEFFV